eukprot:UN34403
MWELEQHQVMRWNFRLSGFCGFTAGLLFPATYATDFFRALQHTNPLWWNLQCWLGSIQEYVDLNYKCKEIGSCLLPSFVSWMRLFGLDRYNTCQESVTIHACELIIVSIACIYFLERVTSGLHNSDEDKDDTSPNSCKVMTEESLLYDFCRNYTYMYSH